MNMPTPTQRKDEGFPLSPFSPLPSPCIPSYPPIVPLSSSQDGKKSTDSVSDSDSACACAPACTHAYARSRAPSARSGSESESGKKFRVSYENVMAPEYDPVWIASALFGNTIANRRIWRWYLKRIGDYDFRELLWQQISENKIDGAPRNKAAAFHAKLQEVFPKEAK